MKKIEVSDEMYIFLKELSKELNTQDHRGTRMPYFFQVREEEEISVPLGNGEIAWYCDGSLLKTEEEISGAINYYKEWATGSPEYEELDEDDKADILEEAGYREVNYDTQHTLSNAFLTSKACDQHIKDNGHNLKSPMNYLSGSFRNPELEKLMQFLCELTGGQLHT